MQHTGPVCVVPGAADMGTAVALLLSTGAFLLVDTFAFLYVNMNNI